MGKKWGNSLIFILLICAFFYCGKQPSEIEEEYGKLKVTALDSESPVDKITIELDDENLGTFSNPHTLNNIEPGRHKVFTYSDSRSSFPEKIWINRDETAELTIQLHSFNPYSGGLAPDFSRLDTEDKEIKLSENRGKITLLFFFEST